jgi:hypothetical protein
MWGIGQTFQELFPTLIWGRGCAAITSCGRSGGSRTRIYAARKGRPSIPPQMLLRSMLLRALYSIRSERQLMERLEFDLLFPLRVDRRTQLV